MLRHRPDQSNRPSVFQLQYYLVIQVLPAQFVTITDAISHN